MKTFLKWINVRLETSEEMGGQWLEEWSVEMIQYEEQREERL